MSRIVELKMSPVGPFYSSNDEAAFFEWLDKIKCVKKYEGHLRTLFIEVDSSEIDEYQLRELLAAFYRYDVDMRQLSVFDRKEFSPWFRSKTAYWYKPIFGAKSGKPKGRAKKKARPNKKTYRR